MPVNGMKAADYQQQTTNHRKERLNELRGFFKSRGLDLPDRIKEEYSDIL